MGPKKRCTLHCLNQLQHSLPAQRARFLDFSMWHFILLDIFIAPLSEGILRGRISQVCRSHVPRLVLTRELPDCRLWPHCPDFRHRESADCRGSSNHSGWATQLSVLHHASCIAYNVMWCLYQMPRTIFVRPPDQATTQVERRNKHHLSNRLCSLYWSCLPPCSLHCITCDVYIRCLQLCLLGCPNKQPLKLMPCFQDLKIHMWHS